MRERERQRERERERERERNRETERDRDRESEREREREREKERVRFRVAAFMLDSGLTWVSTQHLLCRWSQCRSRWRPSRATCDEVQKLRFETSGAATRAIEYRLGAPDSNRYGPLE